MRTHGGFGIVARHGRATICVAMLLAAVGCGDGKQELTLVPAKGKVTLDGKPLADANIEFVPADPNTPGFGGSATTNAEGEFSATSPPGKSGLPPGEYAVVISKWESPPGSPPPDPNLPPISRPGREVLPAAYTDRTMSKLTAKVPAAGEPNIVFALNSKGKP